MLVVKVRKSKDDCDASRGRNEGLGSPVRAPVWHSVLRRTCSGVEVSVCWDSSVFRVQ